jgi:phage baseplate assembly protein gpV
MSTGKTNLTSTQFAAKKLLGKAHTSNLKGDVNESIPSNVSIPSDGVYAESIPNTPGDSFYTLYSASVDDPATVERIYLDVVSISDTIYDANDTGGGGDEASTSGPHGYYLKLPSDYETSSSNPNAGSGVFTNSKRIYDSRGGLQLVHPLISNASPNKYFLKLYKGDPTNPANEITSGDAIDWQVDYYAGTIFIQDYNSSTVPVSASAYLYVGKYLNDKLSELSASAAAVSVNSAVENRLVTVASDTTQMDAEANLTFDGSTMNLTGTLNVSGAINANELNINVTNKEVINLSATGSTNFGDTSDDTHTFTGSLGVHGGSYFGSSSASTHVFEGSLAVSKIPNPNLGSQSIALTGSTSDLHLLFQEEGREGVDGVILAIAGEDFTEPSSIAHKIVTSYTISSSAPISASAYYGDGSNLTGIGAGSFSYSRTNVVETITASVSDVILGINATASLEVRLPSAGDYQSGQHFLIKDEGGNADTHTITIRASGSQTIDGQASVSLQSPYSGINLYSNGSDKFFIY